MTRAILGLGSNVGDRVEHLRGAVTGLGDEVTMISEVFETVPVGGPDQGPFLNLVVVLDTAPEPRRLLERAQALEAAAGRVRAERWGPRTLDVDVLWIDGVSLDEPGLSVPHPRMLERRFVMAPLSQVAPDLCPPGSVEAAEGPVAVAGDLDELASLADQRRRQTLEALLLTRGPVAVTELRAAVAGDTGVAPTARQVARDVAATGCELVAGPGGIPVVRRRGSGATPAVDADRSQHDAGQHDAGSDADEAPVTAPATGHAGDGEAVPPGRERLVVRILIGLFVVAALAAAAIYLGSSGDGTDPALRGGDPTGSVPPDASSVPGPGDPPPTVADVGAWTSVLGPWEEAGDGYRLIEASDGPAILAGEPDLAAVSVSAVVAEPVPNAGVAFAVTDARNYWAWTIAPGLGATVSRVVDGEPTRIGNPAAAEAGAGSMLTAEVTASGAELLLDGEMMLNVDDLGDEPGTGVGLCSLDGDAPAEFRGLVVEAIG